MLQALELFGFKSFADKTRFEFPPGITVVVGPNGSGKSNIVDGIKWVLGAQSAKGLRGQEMADVIFKGAGSGGRRPMNSAEASIVFDNSDAGLPIDAPEVYVTRRVYRSGESEYMINGNPCRLRDIKDLFSGTGLGTGAYSLIEQGKVDTLLQASPKDRRAILEEAAGISRFKAKKLEAQRRLERVDQNLLRLSDIVDEVESRLRSVRAQASKARRYQQYTSRLQELRIQVAQVDWRKLTERLQQAEEAVRLLQTESADIDQQVTDGETAERDLEKQIEQAGRQGDAAQAAVARSREHIAVRQSTVDHLRRQCEQLDAEAGRYRVQTAVLQSRAGDVQQQLDDTQEAFDRAERDFAQMDGSLKEDETRLAEVVEQVDRLRSQTDTRREQRVQRMRRAAELESQIGVCRSQLESAGDTAARNRQRHERLSEQCLEHDAAWETLESSEKEVSEKAQACRSQYGAERDKLDQLRRQLEVVQHKLSDLRGRRHGAAERAAVIEELEERLEGVSAGVKAALRRATDDPDSPFGEIQGLVADALHVGVEHAGMIEVALGESAQHLVVTGHRLMSYLQTGQARLPGRVGFVPLTAAILRKSADHVDLSRHAGVLGRADQFVQCDPKFQLLVRRLLGRTWLVQTLAHAVSLGQTEGRGLRFVTAAGELLEPDGTLVVGHGAKASGIISRRSELASVREFVDQLDGQIADARQRLEEQQQRVAAQEELVENAAAALERCNAALAEHRVRKQNAQARRTELRQQLAVVQGEWDAAEQQRRTAAESVGQKQEELAQAEQVVAELEQQLESEVKQLKEIESRSQDQDRLVTQAKIELAKSEQRLRGLRAAKEQCERSRQERERAIADCRAQLKSCHDRYREAELEILATLAELASRFIELESLQNQVAALAHERDTHQQLRSDRLTATKRLRDQLHKIEQRQHAQELAASQVKHDLRTLADRLREDYGIELAELEEPAGEEQEHERDDVDEEIASLRRKISNIGAVNLEALEELEDLEERFQSLSNQYQDLHAAKGSLEKIIHKINADSRRLFSETLEAVRDNFRSLFRKVFGGGTADIVLEDETDILESGIEVIANPPGKQALSISLLSGGERALTAVTLLLALFQFRPSPFCVLDEVDGPLDEANIGRFVDVLKEFLAWTRFVIVTHSKKTMTAATTLYGVTMQESGVSKRVSVRFEDVSDSGHISQAALERGDEPAAEEDERGAA